MSKKSQTSQPSGNIVLSVDYDKWKAPEARLIVKFLRSKMWEKMRKFSDARLVGRILAQPTDDSFRRGWLSCRIEFDDLAQELDRFLQEVAPLDKTDESKSFDWDDD